jgi:hypothetical protein
VNGIAGSKTVVNHWKTICAAHGGTRICEAGAENGKMETIAENEDKVKKSSAG